MPKFKAKIIFIFITIMLDMIGIGLIVPSLPDVIRRFMSDPHAVSSYYGFFISIYACMQFLASPLLGSLSDLWGRRPILLVSICVGGLDYLLMAFAPTLSILFAGRVLSGLTGANLTVAMAYIADISTDKDRAANFGMIGAAFGLGFIIGPALGGLLGHWGPQYPFIMAAVMNLLNFLFGLFVLPESFPISMRKPMTWKKLNPFLSLRKIFRARLILVFAGVHFLFQLAGQTHPSVWTLYTEYRFHWTRLEVGLSLTAVGFLSALAQGFFTRKIVNRLGEYKTVLIGSFGYVIAFFGFGLATMSWHMYGVLLATCVFWVTGPALQSLITKGLPAEEQGELQGSLVSLSSLASIANPIITTQLFAFFTKPTSPHPAPGAPYFFAAVVSLLAWVLLLSVTNDLTSSEKKA